MNTSNSYPLLSVFACLIGMMTCPIQRVQAQIDPPKQVDDSSAINLGLTYVEKAGQSWIDQRGCVSCHQVPSLIWSHETARLSGLQVDQEKLEQWKRWSTQTRNFVKPAQKDKLDPAATLAGNIDTMIAMLLAIPEAEDQPWAQKYLQKLCEEQAEDGSWKACGQLPLQKRPKLETTAVTTLWATYVLTKHNQDFEREEALNFADAISTADSTEWWAVRLLVANQQASAEELAKFKSGLLRRQNEDGGWGFLAGQASDALGTGYALYALGQIADDSEAIVRARQFLLTTQGKNGSWKVPGTKAAAKDRITATATDWGTAWAIIGLVESRSGLRR